MSESFQGEEKLSRKPYGKKISQKVIDKMIKELEERDPMNPLPIGVYRSHRDYCGVGFLYSGREFVFVRMWDGFPSGESPIFSLANAREAVDFLAEQSDYSMSGYDKSSPLKEGSEFELNNQRLTRRMLENFLSK